MVFGWILLILGIGSFLISGPLTAVYLTLDPLKCPARKYTRLQWSKK